MAIAKTVQSDTGRVCRPGLLPWAVNQSGSQTRLPAPSPLRTVHATFTAHGSSLYKSVFRHPVSQLLQHLHNTHLQPSYVMILVTPESAHAIVAAFICFPSV